MEKLTTLDNGLRVVTRQLDGFESMSCGYWVQAGTVREQKPINGISHFLEHMSFKGTDTRTAKEIAEAIESVGGYLNAYTSRERTVYLSKVLAQDGRIALDILSDMMLNPSFPEDELKREREVVLQEIYQSSDAYDDVVYDNFQAMAFANQSLGWPVLGEVDTVSKMTAEDLREYRRHFYNADNMVFSAAGKLDHDELLDYASKYFEKFPTNKTAPLHEEYSYTGGTITHFTKSAAQAYVVIGFNGVSITSPDYYTMELLSSVLGGGMSSRLFQEVREKRGLVYSVYSFTHSFRKNGIFGVYASASEDKTEELAEVVAAELFKITENITEEEFKRNKVQFKANLLMSQERNSTVCEQLALQTLIFGHPVRKEEILAKIDAVTIDDVKNLMKKILATESTVSVVTMKEHTDEKIAEKIKTGGIKIGSGCMFTSDDQQK